MSRFHRIACRLFVFLLVVGGVAARSKCSAAQPHAPHLPPGFFVDVVAGEPLAYADLLKDLETVRVVYLGESHGVPRHHQWQAKMVGDLAAQTPLVLALEQLDSSQQAAADRYNAGETDFDAFADEAKWKDSWKDFEDYRGAVEAARAAGAPVIALNAPRSIIRKVYRAGGIDQLDRETRGALPTDIWLDEPGYKRLLSIQLMVHMAVDEKTLQPMFEAQAARDAVMAQRLVDFLKSPAHAERKAVVLCGSGHVNYGFGMVSRVRRGLPEVTDRIVVMAACGEVDLAPEMKAMMREIEIPHAELRKLGRPLADYLNVVEPKAIEMRPDDLPDQDPKP